MDMTLESCRRFVEVLASDAPAPGGGGAAALVGAIGTALGNMVGSLTVGKKKYADVQDEILALKAKCDDLQKQLLDQVEADDKGFVPLAKAYGIPKDDPNRDKILEESAQLKEKIADLRDILASETRRKDILRTESMAIRDKYKDDRRTEIASISGEVDIEDLIPQEECVLTLTNFGYAKRQPVDTFTAQRRGGRGITGVGRREEDVATEMFVCNSHDYVLFFTNLGRVYRLKAYEIPEGSRTSKGMNIANLLPLAQEERITSVIRVPEFEEDRFLVMVTRCGIIKRTDLSAYDTARKGGLIALDLNEGDELAWVRMTKGESELLVATRKGMAIRFAETDVRSMGPTYNAKENTKIVFS